MNWRILNVEYRESDGYIKTVYSVLESKELIGENELFARKIFVNDFNDPIDENFIPLEELQPETVLEWVKSGLDVELEETQLQQHLDAELKQHNQTEVKKGFPKHWTQNQS